VSQLALLLRDLHVRPRPEGAELLPRLPALERWLSRATTTPAASGWRGWLTGAAAGAGEVAGGGDAGWAAAGLVPQAEGRHFWFATPVHYIAGLDTVQLHPAGLLELQPAQQQRLALDFARVFQDSPWRLHALGYRELLLEGPDPGPHETTEPAAVLGGDLGASQPQGVAARPLRRLAAEIEMWLHEHPVNIERERLGELPLSGLWLWGGGSAVRRRVSVSNSHWRLHADDAFSAGFAAAAGLAVQPLPASAAALTVIAPTTVVVLPAVCAAGVLDMQRLEQEWFRPLLENLDRGRWSLLTLVQGGMRYELKPAHRWRRWRRPRAWWEYLQR
jgi:hypothetical protein